MNIPQELAEGLKEAGFVETPEQKPDRRAYLKGLHPTVRYYIMARLRGWPDSTALELSTNRPNLFGKVWTKKELQGEYTGFLKLYPQGYNPKPLHRKQRYAGMDGNWACFTCYSWTRQGKEIRHDQKVNPDTGEVSCTCEAWEYTRGKREASIYGDKERLCKHLQNLIHRFVNSSGEAIEWTPNKQSL